MGRPNKRREWFRKNTHKSKSRLLTCVLDNVHTESMLVFAAPRIEHDDDNNNNNDDNNNDDTMENTKEEYNNQTKEEEQEQQEEKNVEEMKEEKDDDNDNDNDDVEADNNNEKRKENEMSSTETGIGAGTSSSHSDERDSKKIKLDHESQIQVPAPVELGSKKKKRKKRKKHLRPLIVTTSKLQLPQQPQQQQKDIQDENQFQSHSISQSLASPNSDSQSKSQIQLQSTNSMQTPIFPKLLSPEEAMENKDKSIQIQIHIKPLLVLDINGILCHRIRESGCDIPSSLLSHLLQLDDLDLQRKKMNVNTNNSVSVDTNDNTNGDNNNNNNDNTNGDNNNDNTNGDNNDNDNTNLDTNINSLPTSFGKETERERIKRVCSFIYRETIGHVAGTPIVARTDLNNLLTFLDEHFTLSIWSSAKKKTVNQLVNLLFPDDIADRLLFVWGQNQCECINGSKKESVKKDNDKIDHNKGANDGHNKGANDGHNKGTNDDKDESQNMNNETNPSSSTTTANTTTTSVHRKPHYCNLIFVKHISKVWAQYPLWNAHNTLLIDDSPEKCPEKYQNNTVHPPPILGLDKTVLLSKLMIEEGCNDDVNNNDKSFHHSTFLDDVNERKQVDFFRKLANIYNNNDKKANDVEMKKNLLDFLTVSGRGHMSWRG
jgi:hypothetical protein